jgi:hypothetical protein
VSDWGPEWARAASARVGAECECRRSGKGSAAGVGRGTRGPEPGARDLRQMISTSGRLDWSHKYVSGSSSTRLATRQVPGRLAEVMVYQKYQGIHRVHRGRSILAVVLGVQAFLGGIFLGRLRWVASSQNHVPSRIQAGKYSRVNIRSSSQLITRDVSALRAACFEAPLKSKYKNAAEASPTLRNCMTLSMIADRARIYYKYELCEGRKVETARTKEGPFLSPRKHDQRLISIQKTFFCGWTILCSLVAGLPCGVVVYRWIWR